MTLPKKLEIAAAGTVALALAGIWVWTAVRRWRRKSPEEIERMRRLAVNTCGRIIPGRIVELFESAPSGPILLYQYEVAGVIYEAAQDMNALPQIAAAAPYLPGQTASVKYDPRQPTNSILACETWCGIPDLAPAREAPGAPKAEPAAPSGEKAP